MHTVVAVALRLGIYIKASHDNEGYVIIWDLMVVHDSEREK